MGKEKKKDSMKQFHKTKYIQFEVLTFNQD